ncbi:MAG: hypothetical protein GY769_20300 [bacterium]|nr:hypothetical protein [bacterium]
MEEGVVNTLLSAGPLGAVIVALGIALVVQNRQLSKAQDARVADAKKVTAMLLELNDKWNTTVSDLAAAVKELRRR